ncbi:MAG: hypothetical protein RIM84_15525 [Alphaproteobacteria bacterium]
MKSYDALRRYNIYTREARKKAMVKALEAVQELNELGVRCRLVGLPSSLDRHLEADDGGKQGMS